MRHYIGIDLGATNSAICSYDGTNVRVWKSPEQNDVTPSAIYVDKRGNRYYGNKAYNQAPYNPTNSATLFKRFMGTSTKIELESAGLSLTPEECSAEILKVLYGYLPEEIRNDPETAVVITVPAAFNQMKKDATLQAAKLAGINNVALMQEPVAAIMSIMRTTKQEGIFLVYDLGGGTFDVSIAENINGKVNLLAHGGIEMCGGRDIDRMVFNQIVIPWLRDNFNLPEDFLINRKYKTFCRIAQWATERAKIELSAMETSTIALSEGEARTFDEDNNEMYIDIELGRNQVDGIISDLVKETVEATRETLTKAGLSANDLEKIVFIGGPTNYKPLRDKIAYELSLPANIDVNPMTAVAEGASIFAESIDWSSSTHNRKASNETIKTNIELGSRIEIDKALSKLAESSKDYENPPPESAMCYSMRVPDSVNIQLKCSKCGKIFTMRVFEGEEDLISNYTNLAGEFNKLGHKAEVLSLCDDCAQRYFPSASSWSKNNIAFSFIAKGSDKPVYSYPSTMSYRDFEYRVALSFLKGSNTIDKLAEDTGTKLNSETYLKHIKEVLGSSMK